MDLYLCKTILGSLNYAKSIITYTNPGEALKYFKQLDLEKDIPELVFLDINMPIMNGFDFLKEVDSLHEKIKTKVKYYVISSSEDLEDIEKINAYPNIIKYLYKPLKKADIN